MTNNGRRSDTWRRLLDKILDTSFYLSFWAQQRACEASLFSPFDISLTVGCQLALNAWQVCLLILLSGLISFQTHQLVTKAFITYAPLLRPDTRANMFSVLMIGVYNIAAVTFYSRRAWHVSLVPAVELICSSPAERCSTYRVSAWPF
jgi:hypothetical protein